MALFWRGSGILLLVWLVACHWTVSLWYDQSTPHHYAQNGWGFFYCALVTLIHGIIVLPRKQKSANENWSAENPRFDGHGGVKSRTLSSHSFMFIPVVFWALIFGALSWFYFSLVKPGDEQASSKPKTEQSILFHT
jgi:hypothetical protein